MFDSLTSRLTEVFGHLTRRGALTSADVEKALRVAKKKLAADGLFRELKRRRFYEKPSVKKKAKEREAARRRQKWLAKRTYR